MTPRFQFDDVVQCWCLLLRGGQHGELCTQALESAHTRHFLHGRSESVWAVTSDSVAFVKVRTSWICTIIDLAWPV
jgi:hypothetical protein